MTSDQAIAEAEAFLASQASSTPDLSTLSDEELIRHLPDEVLLQHIQGQAAPKPDWVASIEQTRLNTEQQIAERPSSIQYLRDVARNPSVAAQQPLRTGLSAIAAPFEAGESIPANIGLALQRGEGSQLPQQLLQGILGERPAQIGDVYRASGVPALQALAAPAGLLLTGGTGAAKTLSRGSIGKGARLTEEAIRPALKLAEIIRSTTAAPSGLSQQILGQAPKVAGVIGKVVGRPLKAMTDPLTEFPYRKTLEVRQGLIKYFREINTTYGDELEKLSANLQGELPTPQIVSTIQRRLQEAGILDPSGGLIPDAVKSMSASEQKMYTLYEELATSPNPTIPFGSFIKTLRTFRSQLRQQARQRNVPIQADERVVSGVLHDMGVLIEPNVQGLASQSLQKINQDYAAQRQVFDLGNRLFKVFKGELDTKSGEKVMGNYHAIAQDQGTQLLLDKLEAAINVPFVKKAKAYSAATALLKEAERARPLGIPLGPAARHGGYLAGQGIAQGLMAPFTAPGQLQQATIRELLKVLNGRESAQSTRQ